MDTISMILQTWPITATIFSFIYSLYDMNLLGLYFAIIASITSTSLNYIMKDISDKFAKNNTKIAKIIRRPANLPNHGCDYFKNCNYKNKQNYGHEWLEKGSSGFPSGHAQYSLLFATFWSLFLYEKYSNDVSQTKKIIMWIGIGLSYLIAFAVCFQRVFVKCHTSLQVTIGSIIGLFLGYGIYKIIKLLMYHTSTKNTYENIYKNSISFTWILISGSIILLLIIILYAILYKINESTGKIIIAQSTSLVQ
jgi:membrane-associated phospholipid phosphatase